jgi:tRNA modification GTPase
VLVVEAGRELEARDREGSAGPGWIVVRTKSDLHPGRGPGPDELGLSVRTGEGLEAVRDRLASLLLDGALADEEIALVGTRQNQAARSALVALDNTRQSIEAGAIEVAAWEARQARIALEELVGGVSSDQILSAVFSSFCIGK